MEVVQDVKITQINANLERGGWECRFQALSDTDMFSIWQNLVLKWRGAFGGCPGSERLAFNGWVLPVRATFDRVGSIADMVAQTSDGFLRRGWLQGIGFMEIDARTHYHQFSDDGTECPAEEMGHTMTIGKLVKHILGYYDTCNDIGPNWVAHTNMVYHPTENPHGWIALDNLEITASADTDAYIVRETDNLWTRLREMAHNEFYEIVFDKSDVLFYQPHPMYQVALPLAVMTFDEDFSVGKPIVDMREASVLRQVRLHAVTDEGDTLHSDYPAAPTFTYGNVLNISRIRCNEQAALDLWAERKFKFENRDFTVRWTAPGLCGLLFELMDRIQITYTGTTSNGVHFDWSDKKFWIHDITVVPDPQFGGRSTFTLEAESV